MPNSSASARTILRRPRSGLSRDDAASFIEIYKQKGVLETDPFVTIDHSRRVGELIEIAAERGRKARPDIKLGICGEHGGDPASIHFCQQAGLNYVSCSPYRVPVAPPCGGTGCHQQQNVQG